MTGMQSFYWDGRHYDLENAGRVKDLRFYLEEAKKAGGPVLELGSGTGTISIEIAKSKIEAVGLEISLPMLRRAEEKARQAGVSPKFIQADMTRFNLGRRFAQVFLPFNALQHLFKDSQVRSMLRCVKKHLIPGGRFILDVYNPKPSRLLSPKAWRPSVFARYRDPDGPGQVVIRQRSFYNPLTRINRVKLNYEIGGKKAKVIEAPFRCFPPHELNDLLQEEGFQIAAKYGNFDRKAFRKSSKWQIPICVI